MEDWPLGEVKRRVVGERTATIAGRRVVYLVFRWIDLSPDPLGGVDRDGTIYLSERLVRGDGRRADLTAFHERIEFEQEASGGGHADAHRRA